MYPNPKLGQVVPCPFRTPLGYKFCLARKRSSKQGFKNFAMVVALAPWSVVVAPGKAVSQDIIRDIQITNAALGATLEDEKARSTLKISYKPPPLSDSEDEEEDDEKNASNKTKTVEIALCSLTPGSVSLLKLL